ncbi:MAG: putative Rhomboid family protein [Labilithrix sp.]|nr:putative Rhomboid family protein [Labilithrix sp.]
MTVPHPAATTPAFELTIPMLVMASVVVVTVLAWIVKPLKYAFLMNPYLVVERFQVHRMLTAGWLHADASHLVFNLFTLYFFADQVVKVLGPIQFLLLYVSAVIVAHVPTVIRHRKNPKYNSLGASGAVAAVIFSGILLVPGLKLSLFFLPIPIPGYAYGIGYLAYSAYASYRARDGVNHDAHFAGAVYGSLLTFALEPQRVMRTVQTFF